MEEEGAGSVGSVLHYLVQIPPTPSPNPYQASALLLLKSGLIDKISAASDDRVAASLPARLPRRSPFEKVKKKQKKPL